MTDLLQLEIAIGKLVDKFVAAPLHFFSERELQAELYGLCRDKFGTARPRGHDIDLPLFRHEYNTLFRYRRREPAGAFTNKLIDSGKAGAFDFAILSAAFVSSNTLFAVINKLERLRSELREPNSPRAIEVAIELKMAHVREHDAVSEGAMRRFRQGVIEDCRKLAHEAVTNSYVLAFSHGPGPDEAGARSILDAGTSEFSRSTIDARLLLVTPTVTYLRGRWLASERIRNAWLIG